MSAGSPNDGITFHLRLSKDQIASDAAAAKTQVVAETKKISDAAKAVFDKEPVRLRIDKEGLRKDLEQLAQMKAALATAGKGTNADMLQSAIGGLEERLGKVVDLKKEFAETEKQAKQVGVAVEEIGAGDSMQKNIDGAIKYGKALAIAHFAAKGLQLAAGAIDLKAAFDSGDFEAVEKAKAGLRQDIMALPGGAGSSGDAIGRIADAGGIPVIKFLRRRVAQLYGTQTNAEMREFDKEQAELKTKMDETDKLIARGKAQAEQSEVLARGVSRNLARAGKSTTEVGVMTADELLEDFNRRIADRPAGTKESGEDRDARRALEENVVAARAEHVQARIDDVRKGINEVIGAGQKLFGEIASRVAEGGEAQIRGQAQVEAMQLEALGDIDDAERRKLDEQIRLKMVAAERFGDFQVQIVERVAEQEIAQLERTQAARREAKEREAQRDQERLNQTAEEFHRQFIEDEKRAIEQGKKEEERAAKEAQRQLDDIAEAEEAVRVASVGSVGLAPQSFVTSGASAMQGIFGPQGQRVIGDVQKATDYLRQIRDNGMMARAS